MRVREKTTQVKGAYQKIRPNSNSVQAHRHLNMTADEIENTNSVQSAIIASNKTYQLVTIFTRESCHLRFTEVRHRKQSQLIVPHRSLSELHMKFLRKD